MTDILDCDKENPMRKLVQTINRLWQKVAVLLDYLAPLADLAARLYVANVFIHSGLSKYRDWDTTLFLFKDIYSVPLLPPEFAAVLATTGELVLPVLLVVGLFTRFSALALFVLNVVAVVSYYSALASSPAAIHDHMEWGIILALIMVAQTRLFTLDRLVVGKLLRGAG